MKHVMDNDHGPRIIDDLDELHLVGDVDNFAGFCCGRL